MPSPMPGTHERRHTLPNACHRSRSHNPKRQSCIQQSSRHMHVAPPTQIVIRRRTGKTPPLNPTPTRTTPRHAALTHHIPGRGNGPLVKPNPYPRGYPIERGRGPRPPPPAPSADIAGRVLYNTGGFTPGGIGVMNVTMGVRVCVGCGVELPPPGPRERNARKWCSEACRLRTYYEKNPDLADRQRVASRERMRELRVAYLAEHPLPPLPSCPICGSPRTTRGAKTCGSKNCQYKLRMQFMPPCVTDGCDRPVQARGLCGTHYAAAWRERNPEQHAAVSRAASSRWAKANPDRRAAVDGRRRARKVAAFVEDVVPSEVFERDRWTCHLCGKKIGKRFKGLNVMAGSVDHVIPLSKGGEHSMQNVRAAHFGCNSRKRDRGGNEQLFLF